MSSIPIQTTFGSLVKDRYHVERVRNARFTTGEIQRRARDVSIIITHVFESDKPADAAWQDYKQTGPMGKYSSLEDPVTNLADRQFVEVTYSASDAYASATKRLSADYDFDQNDDGFIFDLSFPQITKLTADLFSAIGEKYKGNNGASLRDFVCGWLNKAELPEDLSENHYVGLVRYALKVAGYELRPSAS